MNFADQIEFGFIATVVYWMLFSISSSLVTHHNKLLAIIIESPRLFVGRKSK